jgi:hypothetical protein
MAQTRKFGAARRCVCYRGYPTLGGQDPYPFLTRSGPCRAPLFGFWPSLLRPNPTNYSVDQLVNRKIGGIDHVHAPSRVATLPSGPAFPSHRIDLYAAYYILPPLRLDGMHALRRRDTAFSPGLILHSSRKDGVLLIRCSPGMATNNPKGGL